ncbi:MAG: hypothetical protein U0457_04960 [Candidatus Sericytochromatia bacterium]
MKNIKFLTLILILGFFSCNNEKNPLSNINNQVIITKTPTPTPTDIVIIEDLVISYEERCKKLELDNSEIKMYEPYDIVSAKDGSYVYVISNYKKELNFSYSKKISQEHSYGSLRIPSHVKNEIYIKTPEKVIYKITKDKKISLIKDFDYLNCNLDSIEKKENGDLIILSDNKLFSFDGDYYKLESNELTKKINLNNLSFDETSFNKEKPQNIFYENNILYYYFYDFISQKNFPIEFIESYFLNNKISYFLYNYTSIYSNNLIINSKYKNYNLYNSNSYSNYSIFINKKSLNSKLSFENYSSYYSIYEGKPIFDISDIIKDKKEIEKTGKVMRVRKNSKGELFGIDVEKNIIWKIFPDLQKIELLAGSGNAGYKDGKVSEAEFNRLSEIDIDDNDNIYVTDTLNNAIRKITPDGVVSTFYREE